MPLVTCSPGFFLVVVCRHAVDRVLWWHQHASLEGEALFLSGLRLSSGVIAAEEVATEGRTDVMAARADLVFWPIFPDDGARRDGLRWLARLVPPPDLARHEVGATWVVRGEDI